MWKSFIIYVKKFFDRCGKAFPYMSKDYFLVRIVFKSPENQFPFPLLTYSPVSIIPYK